MSDQGSQSYQPCTALYAGCIHEANRGGDRERMRAVEAQASQYVSEVREALDKLRAALGNS
ncbi:MAG TPA: DUF1843 domain-containing protein [Longimicrobium sp.]|nr:DUF1843 domain-containing protein [Longimicrobium sp.]